MWEKYAAIVILLSVIVASAINVDKNKEMKDDTQKMKLGVYSALLGASSILVVYFAYLIYTHMTPKDKVIDAVLNDFLKINE